MEEFGADVDLNEIREGTHIDVTKTHDESCPWCRDYDVAKLNNLFIY